MYFNDVNFALGLMFVAFSGACSAPSGYAPEVFHSRVFHPCYLVPRFSLPHFPLPRFQRPPWDAYNSHSGVRIAPAPNKEYPLQDKFLVTRLCGLLMYNACMEIAEEQNRQCTGLRSTTYHLREIWSQSGEKFKIWTRRGKSRCPEKNLRQWTA